MNRALIFPTILLLVLGITAFVLSGGEPVAARKNTVVFANADELKTLDPGKMSWANDIRTAMGLWEGLTAYHPKTLEILPGVAERWDVSPDAKTYTFHLRKNAKWSNGDPVTAHDFLFAWQRVLTPATGADYITLLQHIKGATDFTTALEKNQPADFSKVAAIAVDDHTLHVELDHPVTYFLDLCAFPPLFPLHEKSMRPFSEGPNTGTYDPKFTRPPHLVTNGAFQLTEWQFKRHLLLTPNEHYWDRANVKVDRLKITALEDQRAAILAYNSGAIDAMSFVPKQFGEELLQLRDDGKRNDVHFRPVFGTYYYIFNCTRKPFDDKRVRRALALVIDRRLITDNVLRMGEAPSTVVVPRNSIPGYTGPAGLDMNIPEAKRLLADAGFPNGAGFPTIEILYNTEAAHDKVALAIAQMWEKHLNIKTSFKGLERGTFGSDRRSNNFLIARGGWYGDYLDPTTWLDLARSTDGNNDGKFKSPAYDALLDQAAAEGNPAKRFELLREAERVLVEDEMPFIPLYQYADGYMYNPNTIEGIDLNVRLLTQFKWLRKK